MRRLCTGSTIIWFPHQTEIFPIDEKPSPMAQIQLKLICGNPSSTKGDCKGIIFSIRGQSKKKFKILSKENFDNITLQNCRSRR